MGSVQFGIPRELALALKAKYGIEVFVETGTLVGHTAEWASKHFKQVATTDVLVTDESRGRLMHLDNVEQCFDDSGFFLECLSMREPILFWLDAHTNEYCPVCAEIHAINRSPLPHVILVDDARLFGDLPAWPTKEEVVWLLINGGKRTVREEGDVLVAEPCP